MAHTLSRREGTPNSAIDPVAPMDAIAGNGSLYMVHYSRLIPRRNIADQSIADCLYRSRHRYKFLEGDEIDSTAPIYHRGGPVYKVYFPYSRTRSLPAGIWDVMVCDPTTCATCIEFGPGEMIDHRNHPWAGRPFAHEDDLFDHQPGLAFEPYADRTFDDFEVTACVEKMIRYVQGDTEIHVNTAVCGPKSCSTCGQYEVESIRNSKYSEGLLQYRVKWKGYTKTTWEPSTNLTGNREIAILIATFHQNNPNKPGP